MSVIIDGTAGLVGGPVTFRNKIISGDFTTNPWQRGTSFTSPASASYTADRFAWIASIDGAVTITKTADSPTAQMLTSDGVQNYDNYI